MVGRNSSDNKFFATPFLVGPVLGDGCNYSTIQSAIDDCFAAGGGVVWIKPGTYVEDLVLRDGVDLNSTAVEGRLPTNPQLNKVVIQGQHTWSPSVGGFVEVVFQDICMIDPTGGAVITSSPTAGTFALMAFKFCGITGDDGAGNGAGIVLNPDGTSFSFIAAQTAQITGATVGIRTVGAGQAMVQLFESSVDSGSGSALSFNTSAHAMQATLSQINGGGGYGIEDVGGALQIFIDRSSVTANDAAINFSAAAGVCTSQHGTYSSNIGVAVVIGTGTFVHADTILTTSTVPLFGVGITETILPWRPYATAGAASAPFSTAPRGTCSFDSAFFSVTDGWVSFIGSSPTIVWVDQPISTTVLSNQGNFITGAGVTLTLPAAPAQGDTVMFKDPLGNAPYVIQANAGQTLQVANQTSGVAGTATSSAIGDAMELTFYAAGNIWCADSVIGVWTVV